MKELSIEEKAKRYDKLFVKASRIYNKENDVLILHTIEDLFPELKESEDKKIKKEIISFIQDDIDEINLKVSGDYDDRDEDDIAHQNWCKKAIAWLENIPYTIDHEKREGFHLGYKAGLEKQGESYTKRDVDDAYVEGMALAKNELEKQGEPSIKWNKNTEGNKPQVNHSVLMKTFQGISEGEWKGEYWEQYRWAGIVRDSDVLSWMELSDLEKQGKQKPTLRERYKNIAESEWFKKTHEGMSVSDDEKVDNVNKIEQKPAWSEKDEKILKAIHNSVDVECLSKNELDYVVMVDWFNALKDRVQPKQEWSEEDATHYNRILKELNLQKEMPINASVIKEVKSDIIWFKSLRPQNTWKPSDEQITVLELASKYERVFTPKQIDILIDLKEQLKKLRGE